MLPVVGLFLFILLVLICCSLNLCKFVLPSYSQGSEAWDVSLEERDAAEDNLQHILEECGSPSHFQCFVDIDSGWVISNFKLHAMVTLQRNVYFMTLFSLI